MLYDCKRISYRIDRRLSGLAGPDYAATISFGLPLEPEDSQYGKSRLRRPDYDIAISLPPPSKLQGSHTRIIARTIRSLTDPSQTHLNLGVFEVTPWNSFH